MSTESREELIKEVMSAGRNQSRTSAMFQQAIADKVGLYVTDVECIDFLMQEGPVTAGRLADITGLTSGAMTAAIDRLEKSGYVERQADPNDRRKVIIKLVPSRLKSGAKLYQNFGQSLFLALQEFSDSELKTIARFENMVAIVYRENAEKINKSK